VKAKTNVVDGFFFPWMLKIAIMIKVREYIHTLIQTQRLYVLLVKDAKNYL